MLFLPTRLLVGQGPPVDAIIKKGMLVGQIKWLILHPGRITFECKCLDECNLAQKEMLPNANPLVVLCLAKAVREWQVALRAIHTNRNEEHIVNTIRMEIYIHRK